MQRSISLEFMELYILHRVAYLFLGRVFFFVIEKKTFFKEAPETRTIAIAPAPGGVAIATIG